MKGVEIDFGATIKIICVILQREKKENSNQIKRHKNKWIDNRISQHLRDKP